MLQIMINLAFTNFDITDLTCITFSNCSRANSFYCFIFCCKWQNRMNFSTSINKDQSILRSFYLWEQNLLMVSQVQAQITSIWYFFFLQIILSNCFMKSLIRFQLRVWIFWWCIQKDLSISSYWSKVET